MVLPEELEREFKIELRRYREENRMPHYASFELDAMAKMAREVVLEVLETRFAGLPPDLSERLNAIEDIALLKRLHKRAITVASVEEFEQVMAQGDPET